MTAIPISDGDAPRDFDYLSRDEALALLGVKRSTLYTYVSRGWIKSVPSEGSRSHVFSREDVERIRARGMAHAGDIASTETAMRWGPPVIATRITQITPEGPRYRGRDVLELARAGYSFEAVAQLLWSGTWHDGRVVWRSAVARRPTGAAAGRKLAGTAGRRTPAAGQLQQQLAARVLELGAQRGIDEVASGETLRIAQEILVALAGGCALLRPRPAPAARAPQAAQAKPAEAGIAQVLANALGAKPGERGIHAINAALVMCADHELSPSALVARVTASTGADLYACVAAGICAHSGPQTGQGCDRVEELVGEGDRAVLRQHLQTVRDYGARLFGFNHPLYPKGDPRAWLMIDLARGLAAPRGAAQDLFWFLREAAERHHAYPGLAVGLVTLCRALELPRGSATALWTVGRAAGLIAHAIEQRLEGFMMRPRARYVG